MDPQRMRRLRRLSCVPRWTIIPTIRKQNVAEHCFHVGWISLTLARATGAIQAGKVATGDLLLTAMEHDDEEAITGDVPSVAKSTDIKAALISSKEKYKLGSGCKDLEILNLIKAADLLEALLFIIEEEWMGNKSLVTIKMDIISNFGRAWEKVNWYNSIPKMGAAEVLVQFTDSMHPVIHPGMEYTNED